MATYWRSRPSRRNRTSNNIWTSVEHPKILGENVVPEETERLIRRFPSVVDCVCVRIELVPGVYILAALIETDGVRVPDQAELHEYLRRNLPAHQVPRRLVFTDELPRLANGKIDRKLAAEAAA